MKGAVGVLLAVVALVLAGGTAGARTASPAYRVGFSVTGVTPPRPGGIVEVRLAATGTASFEGVPVAGRQTKASTASAKVVLEYDVLYPHVKTERITMVEKSGETTYNFDEAKNGAITHQRMSFHDLEVTASTDPCARVGSQAVFIADLDSAKNVGTYSVLTLCGYVVQKSGQTKNSRVHVRFSGECLNPNMAAVDAKPLCGSPPDLITISDGTATAGTYFAGAKNGQNTCVGGFTLSSFAQDCTDDQNVGTTLTLTAHLNGTLPSGSQLWIWYDAPNGSDPVYSRCDPTIKSNCVLAKTSTDNSLTTTVTLPASKSFGGGAHAAEAAVEMVDAQGYSQRGLGIQLCQDGFTPRCG